MLSIQLNDNLFGYVGILKGSNLGVFDLIDSDKTRTVKLDESNFVAYFAYVAANTDPVSMKKIGQIQQLASRWAPPSYIAPDIIDKTYRIIENGDSRRATAEETQGLAEHVYMTPTSLRDWIIDNLKPSNQ